jgi:hypothetical protein
MLGKSATLLPAHSSFRNIVLLNLSIAGVLVKHLVSILLGTAALASTSDVIAQTSYLISKTSYDSSRTKTEVKLCLHDAYAVCSVKWNGKEFIDDFDHGRQLQSAFSFDGRGEGYNPTEAGASYLTDGLNPSPSSSVNDGIVIDSAEQVRTTTRMAYWNPVNGIKLSNWLVDKRITIMNGIHSAYLDYAVTGRSMSNEPRHTSANFEFLTGYMPSEFNKFYTLDVKGTRQLSAISACLNIDTCSPEQPLPLIFANAVGTHAMGIYSRELPQAAYPGAGYGRWNFTTENVVKWNTVYRYNNIIPLARYSYQGYVVIGTLANVRQQMQWFYDNGQ